MQFYKGFVLLTYIWIIYIFIGLKKYIIGQYKLTRKNIKELVMEQQIRPENKHGCVLKINRIY